MKFESDCISINISYIVCSYMDLHKYSWIHLLNVVSKLMLDDATLIAECLSMRHIIVRGRRQWAYCRDPHIFIYLYIYIYVRIYGKMQKYTIAC